MDVSILSALKGRLPGQRFKAKGFFEDSMAREVDNGGVVAKTCVVLREIARAGIGGARITDIVQNSGFARPTVHRILAALKAENFVRQADNRRYQLAPLMHELGLSAPSAVGDLGALYPAIQSLSDDCGDTAYLARRNGDNAYYLLRGEGAYPIRTYVVQPHQALHLVSCHSGRALLAAMPEEEARAIIDRAWSDDRSLFNAATRETLLEEIDYIREHGFGWARDVTFDGVAGLTMAVPNPHGQPYLAVTISCISQRLTFERAVQILPRLRQAVKQIRAIIDQGTVRADEVQAPRLHGRNP